MERPKFIASVSFGKDSLATLLLAKEREEPLDEAVYCEVMFDEGISGEVPEHRDFIYNTAIPTLERMGIKVVVLRSDKTYVGLFTGQVTRGPNKGYGALVSPVREVRRSAGLQGPAHSAVPENPAAGNSPVYRHRPR